MSKKLADGTLAVALFNRSPHITEMTTELVKASGSTGKQPVRDLWQRKDLAETTEAFTTEVAAHGVKLLKIGKPKFD